MKNLSRHRYFLMFFGALYVLFFWPLLRFDSSLLLGDYDLQVYPWLKLYSESLRAGQLPLWTSLIGCGFPLFAEGQTAMLYLPNLLLFKFLEFHTAYNLLFLGHYLAGGLFMYVYLTKNKASQLAAALGAVIYTFGSASAGGFYGIFSLRALVWFPLSLYLIDLFLKNHKKLPLAVFVFIQGQVWLSGSLQFALYSSVFLGVYFILKIDKKKHLKNGLLLFGVALACSMLIGLAQVWATVDFASHSSRVLQDRTFTLWGSAWPTSWATLFMYGLVKYTKTNLYMGLFPFFLVFLFNSRKQHKVEWWLAGIAFFMALGSLNPFYWLLIRLPFISLLRNPGKFLYFGAFFLTVIFAHKFTEFERVWRSSEKARLNGFMRKIATAFCVFFAMFLVFTWLLAVAPGIFEGAGHFYVSHFMQGKSFYSTANPDYSVKIAAFLSEVKNDLALTNPLFARPFLITLVYLLTLYLGTQNKKYSSFVVLVLALLMAGDLALYGKWTPGTSFVGNIDRFNSRVSPEFLPKDGRWLDQTTADKALFPPNRNMLSAHLTAGVYSPLVDKDYFLLVKDWGVVDDSFGRHAKDGALEAGRDLIDFLGVKYLVAKAPVKGYEVLYKDADRAILVNTQARSEYSFVNDLGDVKVLKNGECDVRLGVKSAKPAILSRNQVFDKGWKAYVDGARVPIERFLGAFQSIRVPSGTHEVRLVYRPDWLMAGMFISGIFFAVNLLALVVFIYEKR